MFYGESNGHVTDDVMKSQTRDHNTQLEPNISKTDAGDAI